MSDQQWQQFNSQLFTLARHEHTFQTTHYKCVYYPKNSHNKIHNMKQLR